MSDAHKLKDVFSPLAAEKQRGQVLAPAFREPVPPAPFKFQANNGLWLNVRPEKRGKGWYWYAKNQVNGRRLNIYVAPAGMLSRVLLENAAIHIAAVGEQDAP